MPSVEWDSEDYLIWRNPCLEVGVQGSVAVAVSSCVGQGRLVMRSLVQVVGHYIDVIHVRVHCCNVVAYVSSIGRIFVHAVAAV